MAVRSVHAPEPTALRERRDRLRRRRRDILLASGRHFKTSGLKVKGGYFSVSPEAVGSDDSEDLRPPVAKPCSGLASSKSRTETPRLRDQPASGKGPSKAWSQSVRTVTGRSWSQRFGFPLA